MKLYGRFLLIGLVLALCTEFTLKVMTAVKPWTFLIAACLYPIILSLGYAGSRVLDRVCATTWCADVWYYLASGLGGLAIEWGVLGNGPASHAIQPAMFAMWTTFCFGPRLLTRESAMLAHARRRFWLTFACATALHTALIGLLANPQAQIVIATLGGSGLYMLWSLWLLYLAWRTRPGTRRPRRMHPAMVPISPELGAGAGQHHAKNGWRIE